MSIIPLPRYYIVEATNRCNFKCPICPNMFYSDNQTGDMSLTLFKKILSEITPVAEVIQLYWMGEPLLHQDIFTMIKMCKQNTKSKVMLSTNGSLLAHDVSISLVESGLDEIIISLDAFRSQEIYQRIRTGGDLSKLVDNVIYLLEHKKHLHVVLQFIDLFLNAPEKNAFIEYWSQFDCRISIQCLYTWAGQIPSLYLASNALSPVLQKKRVPCADLWNKIAIHWDGQVSACCFDWNNLLSIGDCNKSSIYQIWNDSPIERLRLLHSRLELSNLPLCHDCDAWAEPEEYTDLFNLKEAQNDE